MQNKKSLLQRLLVIYITFFIVLIASIAHSFVPDFSKGYSQGTAMGNDIVKSWTSGTPRMIYMLGDVPVDTQKEYPVEGLSDASGRKIQAFVKDVELKVEQDAPGISVMGLAFRSIGGSAWLYLLTILGTLSYVAIIVLMFVIIHSLRRSIREEAELSKRNVWALRAIGLLTIFSELCHDIVGWVMSRKAAELLAGSDLVIESALRISYSNIIMGILILFAAEVFAIGQNLSEEQKLTI